MDTQVTSEEVAESIQKRPFAETAKEASTSNHPEFCDPKVAPPPSGSDVLLLTRGGVLVRGRWISNGDYIAWCPMPKMPSWLKKELSNVYFTWPRRSSEA